MQTTKERSSHKSAAAKSAENIAVEFMLDMPQAGSVAVAGNFNDWDVTKKPLRKSANGLWRTAVTLPPGRYEYRFVADGQWLNDPKAKESSPNSFGGKNSVLQVEQLPLAAITNGSQNQFSPKRQVRERAAI
ncbi:MAG: isoamylase early set domain-containing protein [Limisphaerales bacterium]